MLTETDRIPLISHWTAEPAFSRWGCPHWPVLSSRRRCEKLRQRRERPPTQPASVGGQSEHLPFIRPLFKALFETTFQEIVQGQGLKEQTWITPAQVPRTPPLTGLLDTCPVLSEFPWAFTCSHPKQKTWLLPPASLQPWEARRKNQRC